MCFLQIVIFLPDSFNLKDLFNVKKKKTEELELMKIYIGHTYGNLSFFPKGNIDFPLGFWNKKASALRRLKREKIELRCKYDIIVQLIFKQGVIIFEGIVNHNIAIEATRATKLENIRFKIWR